MRVSIIGLGLIGGSMAIKLRQEGFATHLGGLDQDQDHADEAMELRLVDQLREQDQIASESDVIILAIPVDQARTILPRLLRTVSDGTVIMDVGSTKQGICDVARDLPNRRQYVATHPIAGTENYGPAAAFGQLFENKVAILCDTELSDPVAVETVRRLYTTLGATIITMGSKEHDLHAAYVSHLSHISSFTLGLTVLEIEKSEKTIFNLAGSGFDSTVRLAKSSPFMWAPIFDQNSDHLVDALEAYIATLNQFKDLIKKRDTGGLIEMMQKANEIRRVLEGKKLIENSY